MAAIAAERFSIRYGFWRLLLSPLGLGPRFSLVDVDESTVRVLMGWAFRATIPRPQIRSVGKPRRRALWLMGVGAHGGRGRWLVNGSVQGIVEMTIDPPARARVVGVPVRLETLWISMEDPEGFARSTNPG